MSQLTETLKNSPVEVILTVLCLVGMVVFVPLFLKAAWPKKNPKSLLFKMICATFFVAIAVLQMRIANNHSTFALYMLGGFILSWFGDMFLHIPNDKYNKICYPLGVLSFLSGHVFFVLAYVTAGTQLLDTGVFTIFELAALLPICLGIFIYLIRKSKATGNKILPFLVIYAVAVVAMMVKATSLGIGLFIGGEQSLLVAFLLALGGILFVTSDLLLLLIDFCDTPGKPVRFKTPKMKNINIWTYFTAQVLLAMSILFINTNVG